MVSSRSTIELLLMQFFPTYLRSLYPNQKDVVCVVLLFIFRCINTKEFTSRMLDFLDDPASLRRFQSKLIVDGYILKNIKLWLYHFYITDNLSKDYAYASSKKFGVNKNDVDLGIFVKQDEELRSALYSYKDKYEAESLTSFDHNVSRIIKEVDIYTRKFIVKKMKFLMQSHGLLLDDLVMELTISGIQGLFMMYPCIKSPLHSTNIFKRVVHNSGINLIVKHTTKSRSVLSRDVDGNFSSRILPLSMVYETHTYKLTDVNIMTIQGDYGSFLGNSFSLDDLLSIQNILNEYTGHKKTFLYLLTGEYDLFFTKWLHTNRKIQRNVTNDQYYDKLVQQDQLSLYTRLSLQYLGVSYQQGIDFIKELQNRLVSN